MDNWQILDVRFPIGDKEAGFNLRLNPDLAIHRQMIADFRRREMYEPSRSNFLYNILRPGDTFIDIGAHIGYFSLLASALVGRTGFVYSFEPERKNYVQLLANIALNRAGNVQPFEQALGASEMDVAFYVNKSGRDGAHALAEPDSRGRQNAFRQESLHLTTFDNVFGDGTHARVRAVKIAVEGAETDVLRGASRHLEHHAFEVVLCRFDTRRMRRMGSHEADLRALMASFGYECYGLTGDADLIHVPADQPIAGPDQNVTLNVVFAVPDTVRRLAVES
jgi:FkbM family methyltransferase